MHRLRDESRWEFARHESASAFHAASRTTGAHSVKIGSQQIDILIEDRLSRTTLVVFHSALTAKEPTFPVLQGHQLARRSDVNLISVSDPSIALGDVDLGWFLGNRGLGDLRKHLSPLIRHASESLKTERMILFGASGGGYAAVNFGNDFPGSIVLAVNPRLDLSSRPHPKMSEYIKVCHGAKSATPMLRIRRAFVTEKVAENIGEKLPFDLLLFQNLGDTQYLHNQAVPFIESYLSDPRLFVRLEDYAEGHQPIPRDMLQDIVEALSSSGSRKDAITQANFFQPNADSGE